MGGHQPPNGAEAHRAQSAGGYHYRLRFDPDCGRVDETRRLRLSHQTVQQRRIAAGRFASAREPPASPGSEDGCGAN